MNYLRISLTFDLMVSLFLLALLRLRLREVLAPRPHNIRVLSDLCGHLICYLIGRPGQHASSLQDAVAHYSTVTSL
jgi:hypothetical protein